MTALRCALALLLLPAAAQAGQPLHLHYVAYSTGLRVLDVVTDPNHALLPPHISPKQASSSGDRAVAQERRLFDRAA